MSNTKILIYENTPITFGIGENIWMNANEMARAIAELYKVPAKPPKDFLKSDTIIRYVNILEDRFNPRENQKDNRPIEKCTNVLRVVHGGDMPGTWMHEKLALRFAQWLSAEFSLWVDDQIRELLTKGSVSLALPKDYPSALRALADSEEARMIAEASAKENQEKAKVVDVIVDRGKNYTMQEAANVLGTGRKRFFDWLKENGYFQSSGEPYQKYIGKQAYFVVREVVVNNMVKHTPFVTPLGLTHFAKKIEKLEGIRNKSSKTLVLFNPN